MCTRCSQLRTCVQIILINRRWTDHSKFQTLMVDIQYNRVIKLFTPALQHLHSQFSFSCKNGWTQCVPLIQPLMGCELSMDYNAIEFTFTFISCHIMYSHLCCAIRMFSHRVAVLTMGTNEQQRPMQNWYYDMHDLEASEDTAKFYSTMANLM